MGIQLLTIESLVDNVGMDYCQQKRAPSTWRPFVHRGTVSLSGSVYRVLLHLYTNTFESEIEAKDSFAQNVSYLITETKAKLSTADSSFEMLHNEMNSFEL